MPEPSDKARIYRALWPLPGGHGHFLASLLEILAWLQAQPQPTQLALQEWMRGRYKLGLESSTPEGYIQIIQRMGYVVMGSKGKAAVTARGQQLLQSRDSRLVLRYLLTECLGAYEVLATVKRLGAANDKQLLTELRDSYPFWNSTTQYAWRLQWLHSLGCLERAEGGYIITPEGQKALQEFAGGVPTSGATGTRAATLNPTTESDAPPTDDENSSQHFADESESEPTPMILMRDEADRLAERLVQAALESDDAIEFERVLVDAFRFLGFEAEHKSGPGDTDVLVTAPLGQETYRSVVDGKSSRHGKVGKQQIDWWALDRHKRLHKADYMLVVAPGFSSGDLLDNAAKSDAALVTADDLAAVIRLHASTPLSMADLRELFRYAGHPELPLQRVQERAAEVARLQRLVPDIVRTFEHSYRLGVSGPIAPDALHLILARDYGRAVYTKDEIAAALDLLCTPLIGALRKVTENAYGLQMPMASVGRRFQAQARQLLDKKEASTPNSSDFDAHRQGR